MKIPLTELAERLGGTLSDPKSKIQNLKCTGFATDSRDVKPGDLFIAIQGANVDGHTYAEIACQNGAIAALVERPVAGPHILVDNVVDALARMALSFRNEFEGPVIGITGSAGKSSAKEFVAAALSPLGRVMKTAGNRNTEYTAPLMWAELPLSASGLSRGEGLPRFHRGVGGWGDSGFQISDFRLQIADAEHPLSSVGGMGGEGREDFKFQNADFRDPAAIVVEMGMRGLGQIRHLASFSKPNIALITNIGVAHLSELGSRDKIAEAKSEILEFLPENGTAVFWAEDDYADFLRHQARHASVRTFGESEGADARLTFYRALDWDRSELHIAYQGNRYVAEIPVVGRHQALNATAAFLVAVLAGVEPADAARALSGAKLPANRMAIRREGDITYVLDMYNSAPPAVLAALRTVREVLQSEVSPPPNPPMESGQALPSKTMALRGEGESGSQSEVIHTESEISDLQSEISRPLTPQPPLPAVHRGEGESGSQSEIQNPKSKIVAVLGEMRELGEFTEAGHREVGRALVKHGVDEAILLNAGPDGPVHFIEEAAVAAGMPASNIRIATSHEEVRQFLSGLRGPTVVLVKGSRGVELEKALPF